jgi:hypothetical protein
MHTHTHIYIYIYIYIFIFIHTHLCEQLKDKGESFKVVGREGNIIIETRADGEQSSNLYLLVRK